MENDAILETTFTPPAEAPAAERRRILLVTGFFPPYAPTASTRAPTLARYWTEKGHDVRVLAAHNPGKPQVLSHSLPEDAVRFVPFSEVKALRDVAAYHLFGRVPPVQAPVLGGGGHARRAGMDAKLAAGPDLFQRAAPFRAHDRGAVGQGAERPVGGRTAR